MLFKRRKDKDDEEVCFICFDGGELVVCDRRGCPKVYHPSCVNRDEAFFRAKGRWNCGWHICSNCEKSAKYMCYTCTFSLCKGCMSQAGLVLVRGDKGFCATCMSTVMLIESNDKGNKKPGSIDFDDKTGWMSFFKDYWLSVKAKLSLTLEELVRAKTPWKESNDVSRPEYSDDSYANNVHEASSDGSSRHLEGNIRSSKKTKKRPRDIGNVESSVREAESQGTSVSENNDWASEELMEFVGHMKGGDKSALSQFDVQNMLLEYIKQNNLRDPRKKSTIICDSRLQNLFGKMRVGHFEMLKLLELHFPMEHSPVATDDNQEGVVDPDPSQMDAEGTSDASTRMASDRKRRTRKRLEKDSQIDLDDYAAIDAHNINLIYLRRNLMEELIDDIDTFSEKVVGTFVRIRIAGAGQRPDIYRLVQVVGTGKAAKRYKTGKKTTDFTLEILNLNKTEFITVDNISNQEFTEDECKRLKQSIKCGFIGRLCVGEVQEKARVLQSARVKDWLESEKLRLGNLRDRASEQGRRKQLRECVEKLQLLSTPEERIRRLNEVPEIHVDLKMDPDYESSEDDEEMDDRKEVHEDHDRTRESYIHVNGTDGISPGKGGSVSNNNWNGKQNSVKTAWQNRETPALSALDVGSSTSASSRITKSGMNREKEVQMTCDSEPMSDQTNLKYLEVNNNCVMNPRESSVRFEPISGSPSPGVLVNPNVSETEKMWHYKDPSGKVQGPFSVTQLRKWNSTGYFPESLRIWRASEGQEDSILLADALVGKFQKDLPKLEHQCNSSTQPLTVATPDSREGTSGNAFRQNNCSISTDSNQNATNWRSSQPDTCVSGAGNNESVRSDMRAAYPSSWSAPKSEMINQKERVGGWQSSNNNNAWSGQSQVPNTQRPNAPGNHYRPPPYQSRGARSRWNGGHDRHGNWNSNKTRGVQPGGQGYGRQHPNWNQHPSGGQWNNHQNVNNASNQSRNNPIIPPTLLPNNMGWTAAQGAFIKSSPLPSVQVTSSGWGMTQRSNETGKSPILTTESNIIADAKSSVQRWNSGSALNMPTQTITTDAAKSFLIPTTATIADTAVVQSPQMKDYTGHLRMPDEQKKSPEFDAPIISGCPQLPRQDKKTTLNSTLASIGSGSTTELRSDLDKIQSLEIGRPNANPRCEQGAGDVRNPSLSIETQNPVAQCNELDFNKNSSYPYNSSAAENITADVAVRDPSTCTLTRECNSKLNAAPSEACQSSNAQHFGPTDTEPPTLPDALEPASDQGSEAFSTLKQGSAVFSDNPASATNVGGNETSRSSRPEPSISGPVRGDSGNLPETSRSIGTIPTLNSTTRTSAWDATPNPTRGNSQDVPLVPTTTTQPPPPSPWKLNTATELAQTSTGGLGLAPQNSSVAIGPSQANGNMTWAAAIPGTTNTGWGVVMQGNTNVVWGIPAQGNPNLTIGYGTPVQANAEASTGWGTAAQGGMNVDQAWGTPPQGNTNTNVGWAVPAQGNVATNLGWGAPGQLNANSAPGCPVPTQGSINQNFGWGTPVDGNANMNAGLLAGQGNVNQPWNPNDLSNQQNQIRDGHNAGHGARRPSWNTMQTNVGEGSSRPAWEQTGICKFHETGHCKKGAYCNFIHP